MSESEQQLRDALAKIAEVASAAIHGKGSSNEEGEERYTNGVDSDETIRVCTPKLLPSRLRIKAAAVAQAINPVNSPGFGPVAELAVAAPMDPLRIAVLTAKYWGPAPRRLTVSFLDNPETALRAKILSHMNAWSKTCGISFVETQGLGDVRVSRGAGGYWSYLGTDIKLEIGRAHV
mgnify:CR=1 FL=1